jgi:hypothetical protein
MLRPMDSPRGVDGSRSPAVVAIYADQSWLALAGHDPGPVRSSQQYGESDVHRVFLMLALVATVVVLPASSSSAATIRMKYSPFDADGSLRDGL